MADGSRWALPLALGWALAGCSSASESDDSPRFGKLVGGTGALPGPIAGLRYQSSTGAGFTAADGSFEYRPGDEVVFALGDLELARSSAVMKLFALGTGLHLRILNVVLPDVVFTSWHRTRDPLRDAACP